MSNGKCHECKENEGRHYLHELCEDCYENLFSISKTDNEEPEFELKSEVATIVKSNMSNEFAYTQLDNGKLIRVDIGTSNIIYPKQYVFDKDARAKDYEKLVEFILANMVVTDQSPNFEKVNWMFKEVGRN